MARRAQQDNLQGTDGHAAVIPWARTGLNRASARRRATWRRLDDTAHENASTLDPILCQSPPLCPEPLKKSMHGRAASALPRRPHGVSASNPGSRASSAEANDGSRLKVGSVCRTSVSGGVCASKVCACANLPGLVARRDVLLAEEDHEVIEQRPADRLVCRLIDAARPDRHRQSPRRWPASTARCAVPSAYSSLPSPSCASSPPPPSSTQLSACGSKPHSSVGLMMRKYGEISKSRGANRL